MFKAQNERLNKFFCHVIKLNFGSSWNVAKRIMEWESFSYGLNPKKIKLA